MLKRLFFVVVVTITFAAYAFNPGEPASRLVTTGWLRTHLTDSGLCIVDARARQQEYAKSHIPGARYLDMNLITAQSKSGNSALVSSARFAQALGDLGIGRDAIIIVYDDGSNNESAFVIWALDYMNHARAALLDGGYGKWKRESRPLTQVVESHRQVRYQLSGKLNTALRASWHDLVRASSGNNKTILLHAGCDNHPISQQLGDIATRCCWLDRSGNSWISSGLLRLAYDSIGIAAKKPLIVWSSDFESAATYMTLRYILGYSDIRKLDDTTEAPPHEPLGMLNQ